MRHSFKFLLGGLALTSALGVGTIAMLVNRDSEQRESMPTLLLLPSPTITIGWTPEHWDRTTIEPVLYQPIQGASYVYSCAHRECSQKGVLETQIPVVGSIQGDDLNAGNTTWYVVLWTDGYEAFVYSDDVWPVVRTEVPSATPTTAPTAGFVRSADGTIRTLVPASTRRPVRTPVYSSSSGRPANCTEARAMGLSARQAGAYSHLDRDGDGVACYGD